MPTTIWKQTLNLVDVQTIDVPRGAKMLFAREQAFTHIPGYAPAVWFLCDPTCPPVPCKIVICGTGSPAPQDGRFLGSCFIGSFVWHVFVEEGF